MERRWVVKQRGDQVLTKSISEALGVDDHLANLLVQRGISDYEAAKDFFRPSLKNLHDPFLMKDMYKAVERVEVAILNNEKILIYGDYDVDGTTAVALVYSYFRNIHKNIDFYIPDRYDEGYGISIEGIDFAYRNNFTLIISLDCGIKAEEQIAYANTKHIDVIICDHHRPGNQLPQAFAILDAKQPGCNYPYKELSGCGVGFKLIQAYVQKNQIPFDDIKQYLDLVVVSIASDMVPITGENRILAYHGLKLINSNPRPGLQAILAYSGVKKEVKLNKELIFNRELTINDLVFLIGPRLNAAGRIESGKNAVELLITDNVDVAYRIGEQINSYNSERKSLDTHATQEALEMLANDPTNSSKKATVVFNTSWHKGVVGIVASRLIENYYRPTIVLTQSNGLITGSARSVKDFDVYEAIDACSDLLSRFGGHKYAAGLSLEPKNLEAFCKRFEEVVSNTIDDKMLIPEIEMDDVISLNIITPKFYRVLKQFAPFGPENMSPLFRADRVVCHGHPRVVGENHLKLDITHPDYTGLPFSAIAFQQAEHITDIEKGAPFNICFHVEENEWNGKVSLQLRIKDIKL